MQNQIPNKELVEIAVRRYILEKYNSQVWQRENTPSYYYAQGYLSALCTVLGLEIVEDNEKIIIKTAVKNKLWCVVYRSSVINNY